MRRPGRDQLRSVLAAVAGVLGAVALVVAASGWWSVRTLTDSSWVAPRVDALLADPVVSAALAERVVDSVTETIDVRGAVVELAPPELEPLAGVLVAALRPRLEDAVAELVRRDEVRRVVAAASQRAHAVAVDLVEGRPVADGVTVVDDEVRVVILPLVGRSLEMLQSMGLFVDVDLPDLSPGGDPATQRAALSEAFDRELPDDFGEIVVYRGDAVERGGSALATAQRLFVLAGRAVWVTFAAAASMLVISIVMARRRGRAAGLIAAGLAVEVLVLQLVSSRLVRSAIELSTDPAGRIVIGDLVGDLQQRLVRTASVVAVAAVVVIAAAVVIALRPGRPPERPVSRPEPARSVRRASDRDDPPVSGAPVT